LETIQVVLTPGLLKAADKLAKRQKVNRSALIRRALQEYLSRQQVASLEEIERRGYESHPQRTQEYRPWEEIAAWPEE